MIRKIVDHEYEVELLVSEDFADLERWVTLEKEGVWGVKGGGVEGEWLRGSPSLFFREKVKGDFLWEVDVTRLETDAIFEERYRGSKHGIFTPATQYNFNF